MIFCIILRIISTVITSPSLFDFLYPISPRISPPCYFNSPKNFSASLYGGAPLRFRRQISWPVRRRINVDGAGEHRLPPPGGHVVVRREGRPAGGVDADALVARARSLFVDGDAAAAAPAGHSYVDSVDGSIMSGQRIVLKFACGEGKEAARARVRRCGCTWRSLGWTRPGGV